MRYPPKRGVLSHSILFVGDDMEIKLRYNFGDTWNIVPIKPKSSEYREKVNEARRYMIGRLLCDYRSLLAYILNDDELKKAVVDRSKELLRQDVMSFLMEMQFLGAEHKKIYVYISDAGYDWGKSFIYCNIDNALIWRSIMTALDNYFRRLVERNEPTEFEMSFRYRSYGAARRDSKGKEFWLYSREEDKRKYFEKPLDINDICIEREVS